MLGLGLSRCSSQDRRLGLLTWLLDGLRISGVCQCWGWEGRRWPGDSSVPQRLSREPEQAEPWVVGVGHVPSGVLRAHLPQASAVMKGLWATGLSRPAGRVRACASSPACAVNKTCLPRRRSEGPARPSWLILPLGRQEQARGGRVAAAAARRAAERSAGPPQVVPGAQGAARRRGGSGTTCPRRRRHRVPRAECVGSRRGARRWTGRRALAASWAARGPAASAPASRSPC